MLSYCKLHEATCTLHEATCTLAIPRPSHLDKHCTYTEAISCLMISSYRHKNVYTYVYTYVDMPTSYPKLHIRNYMCILKTSSSITKACIYTYVAT